MPGRVSVTRGKRAPTLSPDADFGLCVIGAASKSPLAAGKVSAPYGSASALATDYGQGDAVDAAAQAVARTPGNPSPMGVCLYRSPSTTPGSYGSVTQTGTGTVVAAAKSAVVPPGTYEPFGVVVTGGVLGVDGVEIAWSLDGGRTLSGAIPLRTDTSYTFASSEAGISFSQAPVVGSTDASSAGLYGGSSTLDGLTLILTVNGVAHTLTLSKLTNVATSSALLAAIHSTWSALTATLAASTSYLTMTNTGGSIVVGAGTANTLLGLTAGTYEATFVAGDTIATSTTPPMFAAADLYTAATDSTAASGAFAAIAECSQPFGLLAISEPIVSADYDGVTHTTTVFSTLVAGLDYLLTYNKRPSLLCRFRDPIAGETDAAYLAAVRAFCAAHQDARIAIVAAHGWVADAITGRRYARIMLAPLLARLQSFYNFGEERLAHSPACAADGPLEGFSIVDDSGHLLTGAHDEFVRGGLDGPIGGVGGAITSCYQRDEATRGTYVSAAPVLHAADDTVVTLMDARVSSGIEREMYSEAWLQVQSAEIVQGTTLDADAVAAFEQALRSRILAKFEREIANPGDPNLVTVDPTVVVDPGTGEITITAYVNDRLFDYVGGVNITVRNLRS